MLYIIGTPIGNLGDITFRAVEVLQTIDALICEDSRRTRSLLSAVCNRAQPDLIVANDHSENSQIDHVLARLAKGEVLGLVSDAGMPTVSDPGALIVQAVVSAGYEVKVIPGPSALSASFSLSAIAATRLVFEGFLPSKGSLRSRRLMEVAIEQRPVVLYEAPHRLCKTLHDLAAVCGRDRHVVICRELTKLYEQTLRGALSEVIEYFEQQSPRGEFVIVVSGADRSSADPADAELAMLLAEQLDLGLSKRDAVAQVVALTGVSRRRVYELANKLNVDK